MRRKIGSGFERKVRFTTECFGKYAEGIRVIASVHYRQVIIVD